jgi:hypothetical protein
MAKLNAGAFDQPLVFAVAITFTVVGMIALMSWFFASVHWTGPLGLLKGGVVQG